MDLELSIIVPCYNESNNLDRLISAFREALAQRQGVELVLVDNGSQDDTPDRLAELLQRPENSFARSVRVEVNQGYGHGIMFGLRAAQGEFLAWTHADLQTPPADVVHALDEIHQLPNPQRSLVRGNRQGRPFFDQFFTSAMGWVASAALKSSLYDVNAQPKVFHHSLMQELPQAPDDFTLDLYLLHRANQLELDVKTVPVRFDERTEGESKGGGTLKGKYKLCKRTLLQIWNLRRTLRADPSESPLSVEDPKEMDASQNRQRAA